MTLPCLRCGKELRSAIPSMVRENIPVWQPENQPSAGTTFTARGHYGSTVFDYEQPDFLEINICDECLLKAGAEGRVLRCTPEPTRARKAKPWDVSKMEWCEHCGMAVGRPHERHYDEPPW